MEASLLEERVHAAEQMNHSPASDIATAVGKKLYDPKYEAQVKFVTSQLQLHGLTFITSFLDQMSQVQSDRAKSIVWNATRNLIINPAYETAQMLIPNSDDTSFQEVWRTCADR